MDKAIFICIYVHMFVSDNNNYRSLKGILEQKGIGGVSQELENVNT